MITEDDYVNYVDSDSIVAENLSANQRIFLRNINAQLSEIEEKIKIEVDKLCAFGDSKISDHPSYFDDYDVVSHIMFGLAENDPAFKYGNLNILVQLSEPSKVKRWLGGRYNIADHKNHNEFKDDNHPMSQEHHCWLYRCLYEQTDLGWSNMLRIGSICLDINVEFLKVIPINNSSPPA